MSTPSLVFTPNDIKVAFPALVLLRQLDPEQASSPAYTELERAFYPQQEGVKPFAFAPQHVSILLNAIITFYGFASSGFAQIQGADGQDLSPMAAERSKSLAERLCASMQMSPIALARSLENSIRDAQEHVKELWIERGLIQPTDGQA